MPLNRTKLLTAQVGVVYSCLQLTFSRNVSFCLTLWMTQPWIKFMVNIYRRHDLTIVMGFEYFYTMFAISVNVLV